MPRPHSWSSAAPTSCNREPTPTSATCVLAAAPCSPLAASCAPHAQCPKCDGFQIGNPRAPRMQCAKCNCEFCFFHSMAHPPAESCAAYERRSRQQDKVSRDAAADGALPCPSCGTMTAKTGGCNQIKCPVVCARAGGAGLRRGRRLAPRQSRRHRVRPRSARRRGAGCAGSASASPSCPSTTCGATPSRTRAPSRRASRPARPPPRWNVCGCPNR